MVVIRIAESKTRCPFSKTFIKLQNRICLFNIHQFDAFKKIINEGLNYLFPEDIINIIIEKTGYQKLIGRFGHENLTYWSKKTMEKKSKKYLYYKSIENNETSDESSDESY